MYNVDKEAIKNLMNLNVAKDKNDDDASPEWSHRQSGSEESKQQMPSASRPQQR